MIVEAAPARYAVEVRHGFGLWQRAKVVPCEAFGHFDFAGNLEVPLGWIEMRDAAVMEDRPLEGERLSRRQTAFGLGFIFQLFACS